MIAEVTTIPILQIRGNSALIYDEYVYARRYAHRLKARANMKQARKGRYSGKMTAGTRKRLARSATLMAQACKARWVTNPVTGKIFFHKLSFITLTVSSSENMTAKQCHKILLEPFLQWMRRSQGVTTYLWKAELQKRGQIHYHITTPTFLHWRDIRDKWNELQFNAGLLKDFAQKFGHTDPNSTDIHEVVHVKDMARYLVKELAKSMQNEQATQGKIWDCSDNLAGVPYFSLQLTRYHEKALSDMRDTGDIVMFSGDRWTIIDFNDSSPPDLLEDPDRLAMDKFLEQIINGKPAPQLELEFIDQAAAAPIVLEQWKPIQINLF